MNKTDSLLSNKFSLPVLVSVKKKYMFPLAVIPRLNRATQPHFSGLSDQVGQWQIVRLFLCWPSYLILDSS